MRLLFFLFWSTAERISHIQALKLSRKRQKGTKWNTGLWYLKHIHTPNVWLWLKRSWKRKFYRHSHKLSAKDFNKHLFHFSLLIILLLIFQLEAFLTNDAFQEVSFYCLYALSAIWYAHFTRLLFLFLIFLLFVVWMALEMAHFVPANGNLIEFY